MVFTYCLEKEEHISEVYFSIAVYVVFLFVGAPEMGEPESGIFKIYFSIIQRLIMESYELGDLEF